MTRWLHVEASPRGAQSRSSRLAKAFLAELRPMDRFETLNLWSADLPPLDAMTVEGRYALVHGEESAPSNLAGWAPVIDWTDHFKSFDAYLISTPMWNFGLPYRLKHYIDVLTQPGLTFAASAEGAVEGLVAGRRAVVLSTSAWSYGPDSGIGHLDYQDPYLRVWLGFIGLTDVSWAHAAPMFGDASVVAAAMDDALARARGLARGFAS